MTALAKGKKETDQSAQAQGSDGDQNCSHPTRYKHLPVLINRIPLQPVRELMKGKKQDAGDRQQGEAEVESPHPKRRGCGSRLPGSKKNA